MSTVVGTVSKIEGVVRAINPVTGEIRILEEGSQVLAGEIIQTSGKGGVVVDMDNGTLLTLGRDTQMRLDDDVVGKASGMDSATEGAVDVEALQQAVLEGNFDALEATAAGEALLIGSASDGGVFVERLGLQGEVTSGFDTTANEQDFTDVVRDANTVAEIIPVVSISGDAVVAEGSEATYTLTTDTVSNQPYTVTVTTGHITTQDGDYVAITQDVIIPAGATSVAFKVKTNDDYISDNGEQYSVSITGVVNPQYNTVELGNTEVVTTIVDNTIPGTESGEDVVTISIVATDAQGNILGKSEVAEGDKAYYKLVAKDPNGQIINGATGTADVTFTDGTAGNADYSAANITGQSLGTVFSADALDDYIKDNGETFNVTITNPVAPAYETVKLGDDKVVTTITDNSTPGTESGEDVVTISIVATDAQGNILGKSEVAEGDKAYYKLVAKDPNGQIINGATGTADVTFTDGTAGNADYSAANITGQSLGTVFSADALDDYIKDNGETFNVTITNPVAPAYETVKLGDDKVVTTITDNSTPGTESGEDVVTISIVATDAQGNILGKSEVAEGDKAYYKLVAKDPNGQIINGATGTADVTFTDGTAGNADYSAANITGQSLGTVFSADALDDYIKDNGETFNVTITNPVAPAYETVKLGDDKVVTTITDNSTPGTESGEDVVTISIVATDAQGNILGKSEVAEGDKAYYKLVAKDPNGQIINGATGTADVTFTDGTAGNADYSAANITGQSLGTVFSADALDDYIKDNGETFNVTITNPVAPAYETVKLGDDKVVTTITDETVSGPEDTVYAVIEGPVPTKEGDLTANFIVKLLDKDGNPVTVTEATEVEIVFTNGSAEVGDYDATTQTVTINPNSSSETFNVQTYVDVDLNDETFNAKINSVDAKGQFEKVDINGFTDTNNVVHDANVDATILDDDTRPDAAGGNVITCEDTTYTFTVSDFNYSDADGDAMQSVRIDSLPADGVIYLDGQAISAGTEVSVADVTAGKLTFEPDLNESGRDELPTAGTGDQKQDYAQFNFSVSDGSNWSDAATMTVDVTPVADTPDLGVSGSVTTSHTIDVNNINDGLGYKITAFNADGSEGQISVITGTNHDGFGVQGAVDNNNGAASEIGYNSATGESESIVVDLDSPISSINVALSWQNPDEDAVYEFYQKQADGSYVKVGESFDIGGNDQVEASQDLAPANGEVFDRIVIKPTGSGSDFLIHEIKLNTTENGEDSVSVLEGGIVDLTIDSAVTDTDGSESLGLLVNDIPVGMIITDGTNNFTATNGGQSVDVTNWDLSQLQVQVPEDYIGDTAQQAYTINVVATSTESIKQYITAEQQGENCPLEATATAPYEIVVVNKVVEMNIAAADRALDEDNLISVSGDDSVTGTFTYQGVNSVEFASYDNADSGLKHNGQTVLMTTSADGGTIVGSANGVVVFVATLDANAQTYTVALKESVDHAVDNNTESDVQLALGVVGTSATGTINADINVLINDDKPTAADVVINEANDGSITITGADLGAYVPEDETTLTWDLDNSTIPSPLYVDGKEVSFSVDGDKVIGTDTNGKVVFTLDPTLADGNGSTYSLTMDGQTALGQVATATVFDVISGGNTDTAKFGFSDATGKIMTTATVTSVDNDTTDSDTVNTRDKYIGVDNNWIEGGNGNILTFKYDGQVKEANFSCNGLNNGEKALWTAKAIDANGNEVTLTGEVLGTGQGASSTNDEYFDIVAPAGGYITEVQFQADGSDDYRLGFEGLDVFDYNTDIDMSFNYDLIDADGDTDSGKVDIHLDGSGYQQSVQSEDELQVLDFTAISNTVNVNITLDLSGSMTKDGNDDPSIFQSRIDLAKQAINNMLDQYGASSDVNVRITTFDTRGSVLSSNGSEWMSLTDAKAKVDSLATGGWTNFEDAMYNTYNNYSEPAADKTVAYFITDGEPTAENIGYTSEVYKSKDGDGSWFDESGWVDSSYQNGWNSFVDNYVDDLYVVGISNDIQDPTYLNLLAQAGGTTPMLISDVAQLEAAIDPTTISVSGTVSDNVVADSAVTFDAIVVNGITYSAADYANGSVTLSGNDAPDGVGKLTFNFTNGNYLYSVSDSEVNNGMDDDPLRTFDIVASDEQGIGTQFNVNFSLNTKTDSNIDASQFEGSVIVADSVDTNITNFDTESDSLDLSEVITDNAATADTLADYLDFAMLDSQGNETNDATQAVGTRIDVDTDGDSNTTDDVRSIILEDTVVEGLDDINIDYQND
ncbi:retention module-containing protein [Thiomicrorhabdus sediminis]|uniref:retention module-containing protein n=1 Tax=Thiomicrorhabdus sediminis TaxID=2580412 RepID=UPI00143D9CEA|nr:retention module-containing protein [Thiomicrorhabdus sediminis]